MNAHPSWATAVPLTTELLRARAPRREDALKQFNPLFQLLPPLAAEEIQKFNSAPVRTSIAGDGFRTLAPEEQEENAFVFLSPRGPLRVWLEADRAFDSLMCELAFGGVGVEVGEEEANRPPSNIEKKLRKAALALVVQRLPESFLKLNELVLQPVDTAAPSYKKPKPVAEDCIQLRILVNAFSQAAEMQMLFVQSDLERLLNVATEKPKAKGPVARDVLNECPFELGVFLAPVQVPLSAILDLQPGALLPLGIGTSDAVSIKCADIDVFDGMLSVNDQTYQVRLGAADAANSAASYSAPPALAMPEPMAMLPNDFPPPPMADVASGVPQ